MRLTILFFLIFCSNAATAQSIPAFPGAQGFGANTTTGGRGGQVLYVTNLNCDGPGSLNAALATPGPKYILFKVSGIIDCAAELLYGDCYIAGQTSPGGIIVRGLLMDDWYDPAGSARNVIVRHLNMRPSLESVRPGSGWVMDDGLRIDGASEVLIDHCSMANATDEAVQISRSNNVTIQFSTLSETLGDHFEFGGMLLNYSAENHRKDSISIHHNIWNRLGGRFPEIGCEQSGEAPGDMSCLQHPLRIEVSNNLLWDQQIEMYYNSGFYTSDQEAPGLKLKSNFVRNVSVVRPAYCNGMFRNLMLNFSDNELFVEGNVMNKYPTYHDYQLFYCCNDFCQSGNNPNTENGSAVHRSARWPFPALDYTPAADLPQYLAQRAGAFNCYSNGRRDPMNRRLTAPVLAGVIAAQPVNGQDYFNDAFALDFTAQPPAPADSDNDGMPDNWETAHGLQPNTADHNGLQLSVALTGVAGYTNLECYLNELSDRLVAGTCGVTAAPEPPAAPALALWFDQRQNELHYETEFVAGQNNGQITILDSAGRSVREFRPMNPTGVMSLKQVPPGLYFARFKVGTAVRTIRLVVVKS